MRNRKAAPTKAQTRTMETQTRMRLSSLSLKNQKLGIPKQRNKERDKHAKRSQDSPDQSSQQSKIVVTHTKFEEQVSEVASNRAEGKDASQPPPKTHSRRDLGDCHSSTAQEKQDEPTQEDEGAALTFMESLTLTAEQKKEFNEARDQKTKKGIREIIFGEKTKPLVQDTKQKVKDVKDQMEVRQGRRPKDKKATMVEIANQPGGQRKNEE